jgi:DnaJ family protein C protein 7
MSLSDPRISLTPSSYTPKQSVSSFLSSARTVLTVPYTDINPSEPAYLTNRAASYIALKRFRPALEDCQNAATIQSASPSPKTLIRLARCQLALGSPTPALSTLRAALAIDPMNNAAFQLQDKVLELEAHLRHFESAKARKEWGMARLALDKCLQSVEAEAEEIPTEWRLWRVELELVRGNWDSASIAAKYVPPSQNFFFTPLIPTCLQ